MMGKMCKSLTGLLVLVAGASLAASGFGMLDVMLSHKVAGVLLALVGLSFLAHGMGMCQMCCKESGCCQAEMPTKKSRK